MNRHCIKFEYSGIRDDLAIQLAFSKKLTEERKEWLTKFMEQRTQNQTYLYQKDTRKINYTEFVNKELVLFSNLDNERSIPSMIDGFKPGQRKGIQLITKLLTNIYQ
jgi:DNA topoisomerase-2